jgi:hypothetical protein
VPGLRLYQSKLVHCHAFNLDTSSTSGGCQCDAEPRKISQLGSLVEPGKDLRRVKSNELRLAKIDLVDIDVVITRIEVLANTLDMLARVWAQRHARKHLFALDD